jgi:ppGpp synthetase/RelA/SpoT-type nucleotidyltranferase
MLTDAVITIVRNFLSANKIEYLAVTGQTKEIEGIHEKIRRKSYNNPSEQLTDISGVRIILFLESDVLRVERLISNSFRIFSEHSSNKDSLLQSNQVGYRSTHFVCDLGEHRSAVPEYSSISSLKFEFQVRTVLQHAWAELSHDRQYKFSGKLPPQIARKLYLYAGMLELADRGFDEISEEIDSYVLGLRKSIRTDLLDAQIDSFSLKEFFEEWSRRNHLNINGNFSGADISPIIAELESYGLKNLGELANIEPKNAVTVMKELNTTNTIFGTFRIWMITHDYKRLLDRHDVDWQLSDEDKTLFMKLMSKKDYEGLAARKGLWLT